jgi:hypothetical protein
MLTVLIWLSLLYNPPQPMWNGMILSEVPEASGWTMDQLRCGVPDPSQDHFGDARGYAMGIGKEVKGWHVEEDPKHMLYSLHAGGWVPSGIPVPICVLDEKVRP